jgi:nitrate/nitrite-specific signal transduction histidine kinase
MPDPTEGDEWPVQPVSDAAKSSSASLPATVESVLQRLDQLTQALQEQNQHLSLLLQINQAMLEELVGNDDPDEPTRDLAGRPLRSA